MATKYSAYSDVVSATTYQAELGAYISGLVTPLSVGQKNLLNTFILALKTGMGITNLSDVFDCLWILAGETSESSLRNLVKNDHHCTLSHPATPTPAFAQYEGFTGNGINSYIKTDYIPSADGDKYKLNDNGYGVYGRTSVAYNTSKTLIGTIDAGIASRIIPFRTETTGRHYAQNNASIATNTTNSLGLFSTYRYGSNAAKGGHNKTFSAAETTASVAISTIEPYICGYNSIGTIAGATDEQVSMAYYSKSLISAVSQVAHDCLQDAFEAYMDARGKGVI